MSRFQIFEKDILEYEGICNSLNINKRQDTMMFGNYAAGCGPIRIDINFTCTFYYNDLKELERNLYTYDRKLYDFQFYHQENHKYVAKNCFVSQYEYAEQVHDLIMVSVDLVCGELTTECVFERTNWKIHNPIILNPEIEMLEKFLAFD